MKLSIVVIFCDKDIDVLQRCLDSISKHLFIEHEIILVDNRNNQTPLNLPYKIVTKGYNTYLFEGRRLGLDACNYEWTWFVDADDWIIDDVYPIETDADLIQFYYKKYDTKPFQEIKMGSIKKNIRCFGRNLWSRWFKTENLRKVLAPIKRDINLVNFEDGFLIDLYTENFKKYLIVNKAIYCYNRTSSVQFGGEFTQEKLNHSLIGSENLEYLYSFVPNGEEHLKLAIKENNYLKTLVKS